MMEQLKETLNKGGSQEPMEENKVVTEFENTEENKNTPEDPKKKPEDKETPPNTSACGTKKKEYNLEDVEEYTELLNKFNALESQYSALEQDKAALDTEIAALREFKLTAERKEKQQMIDSFYMLSDEDKKDVTEHIDTYSLDDIEAKLSIICVRNKVNFNLNDDKKNEQEDNPQGLFNLNGGITDNAPDWIKAIRETAKSSI